MIYSLLTLLEGLENNLYWRELMFWWSFVVESEFKIQSKFHVLGVVKLDHMVTKTFVGGTSWGEWVRAQGVQTSWEMASIFNHKFPLQSNSQFHHHHCSYKVGQLLRFNNEVCFANLTIASNGSNSNKSD